METLKIITVRAAVYLIWAGAVALAIYLVRKRNLKKYGFETESDPNDKICSTCGFDQWGGYKTCQKCGKPIT